ncbi:MAG TPA: acyl-CoA dehydrogenase family protein [Thermoanaerobaculia bacterium]|nr:acyl-CoA dehydrogenase family protein [Thermoanaerobaculia bacterium]
MTTVQSPITRPEAVRRLLPLLRERADEAERARRLPRDVAQRMAEAGIFRMGVPRSLGGAEAPLPELLETIEALATADSAAAWCAMIGATTGILAARLPSGWAQEIYGRNPSAITVGAIAPVGRATPVSEGGVRVTGAWRWGSGIHVADWVVGGTVFPAGERSSMSGPAADGGELERDGPPPGPDTRLVFFRRNEVDIADDWHTSGMRGTGSSSFRVEGVRVPQGRWASLDEEPREGGPLYRFNVWSLLALGVAAVPLGIARRALEEFLALAAEKVPTGSRRTAAERAVVQRQVAEAEAAISASRAFFFDATAAAWATATSGAALSIVERARLRLAATHAAHRCAAAVDLLYHAGGGTSVYEASFLQKAFRDVHVITQHLVVADRSLELLGRLRLGLETDVRQL